MNIQELREKVLNIIREGNYPSNTGACLEAVGYFFEFEQSNEQENNYCDAKSGFVGSKKDVILKRRTKEEMNTHILLTMETNRQNHAKEIEDMKSILKTLEDDKVLSIACQENLNKQLLIQSKEIEDLKEINKSQVKFNECILKDVKSIIVELDKEKLVSNPKQERFYYKFFENYNRANELYKYQIYDREAKYFNPQGLCSESMAIDLCKHLNSLEGK